MSKTIKKLYIAVDTETCVACGSCQAWAPDVFAYDKFSIAYNLLDDNTGQVPIPEEMWDDVLPTTVLCPTRAIKYSETPFESTNFTEVWVADSPDNQNINYELTDDEWAANELGEKDPLAAKKKYLAEKKAAQLLDKPVLAKNLFSIVDKKASHGAGGCGCGGGGACGCGGGGGGCAH